MLTFGIPRWNDAGERECYGFDLFGWFASLLSSEYGGGGASVGDGGMTFTDIIGSSTPFSSDISSAGAIGSGFSYIPIFSGDPYALQADWEGIDSDFYMETGGDDDPDNTNGSGPVGSIPHTITLNNGSSVNIEFGTTDDGDNADHMVSQRLIDGLIAALNSASQFVNIYSIYIKATTNGSHSNPNSNHYRGTAIDLSRINGVPMILSGANNIVTTLQNALDVVPYRRENFGPAFKHKFGVPYSVGGHKDHIHFSVDGY